MKTAQINVAAFLAIAALMGGCANTDYQPTSSSSSYSGVTYGVIDSIETVSGSGGGIGGIGAGTVIGGVVGGVLGSQVGGGTGKDVATVAGVVGGAMVRLDNGGYQTVTQPSVTSLRVGDRVRIENDRVSRY